MIEMENKGKPARFACDWCEKQVKGFLTLVVKDYVKNEIKKEYVHDACPYRVTRITIEGTL